MSVVRTVYGDIAPEELGPCDAHEHLFLETPIQPGDDFTDVERAIEEARTLAVAGAASLVDWTPLGMGRSQELSDRIFVANPARAFAFEPRS